VKAYQSDLAFIHDRGFSTLSLQAASVLPRLFRKHGIPGIHIVELGCGSGRLAHELTRKGFRVSGFDYSRSMVSLAKRNAPQGNFRVGSLWDLRIPSADAVIAVGEVLNYQFDGEVNLQRLKKLFDRIFDALQPSGLLIFDILCARQGGKRIRTRSFVEGNGWLVAVDKSDSSGQVLRRITSFRKVGGVYRKSIEVHRARRYDLSRLCSCLRDIGFKVSTFRGYGTRPFGNGRAVVLGKKPEQANEA